MLSFRGSILTCTDAATGKTVWQFTEFAGSGAPALAGDLLIAGGNLNRKAKVRLGVNALRLTPAGAKRIWQTEPPNAIANHASVCVWQGHVYAKVGTNEKNKFAIICLDLQTGKELSRCEGVAGYSSLLVGDGRMIYAGNRDVFLYDATPAKVRCLPGVIAGCANSVTPVLLDGVLYVRQGNRLAAYSLKTATKKEN